MKAFALMVALFWCSSTVFAQDQVQELFAQPRVTPEEKALLEQMSHDSSFTVINRERDHLAAMNAHKQKLFEAYLKKSPETIKVFKEERVGWEGQYTKTWFMVDHGKVKIIEAYFGDPSGSGKLQYVRTYTPEEIKLGYLDKAWKFVPLTDNQIPKNKELAIGYQVASELGMKRF